MTTVRYEPDEYRMTVSGHAGSARAGEDLVCAACTALAYALIAGSMERPEFRAALYENQKDGIIRVQCYPDEEAENYCAYLFRVIFGGYRMLAEKYPEYVSTEIIAEEETE